MMSTRTPKKGRLLLAAACGLALVTQAQAGERATEPSRDELRNVREQLDVLYRERGLVGNTTSEPRTLEIAANDTVAPAPSVQEDAEDVPAEIPVRTQRRTVRRNAGRSSRRLPSRPATRPVPPAPIGGEESVAPRNPPVRSISSEESIAPDVAPVVDAKTTGDTSPQPLPEATPAPAPRRGFVLFGRRRPNDDRQESTGKKRSLLSRIFNRGKRTDEEVQVAAPDATSEPGPTEAVEEAVVASDRGPIFEPKPSTELPEPSTTPNGFELPAPTERPVDAVVESSDDSPEGTIATAEPTREKPIPEELDNPFPELSESEADASAAESVAGNDSESAENPFEVEPMPEPEAPKADAVATPDDAATEDNPFAVTAPAEKVAMEEVSEDKEPAQEELAQEEPADEQPAIRPRQIASKPQPEATPDVDVDPRIKRIRERENLTGLKGFCPVALRDDRQLVDSDEEYTVVHKSRTYTLSSKEAVRKFEADPQKYAPVASGHDVILLTVEGRRVEGSLDHAVWYKDRLHLFSNRETLSRFVRSLNRDPFAGSGTRPASNEVPAKESKPAARPEQTSGPQIELPAPLPKDESAGEENPFEFDN